MLSASGLAGPSPRPRISLALSQQPVPEQLRIQVSRVSMHDYEALHYDKEQLKEACEWRAGLGGVLRAGWWMQPLMACSVLQRCPWALWWSQETATSSSAGRTSRGSSR